MCNLIQLIDKLLQHHLSKKDKLKLNIFHFWYILVHVHKKRIIKLALVYPKDFQVITDLELNITFIFLENGYINREFNKG